MQDDPPARDGLDQALTAASAAHDLVERLSRELITQRTRAEQLDAELEALRATRLFRYTLRLRAAYGKLRKP